MPLEFEVKMIRQFFDRDAVIKAMDAKSRRALSKAGAFLRRRARSSLRRRKKASIPPNPPSVHSSDSFATLKNILFAYDRDAQTVVVGPVRTKQATITAPALHEFGGATIIKTKAGRGRPSTRRRARYPKRPFMGPALQAELTAGTIPRAFAGPLGSVTPEL